MDLFPLYTWRGLEASSRTELSSLPAAYVAVLALLADNIFIMLHTHS